MSKLETIGPGLLILTIAPNTCANNQVFNLTASGRMPIEQFVPCPRFLRFPYHIIHIVVVIKSVRSVMGIFTAGEITSHFLKQANGGKWVGCDRV